MATYQFGVVGGPGAGTYGLVQNFNLNKTSGVATAKDENGEVAAVHPFDRKWTADFEVVVDTETTLPEEGSILAIDGVNYVVLTVKETENNGDYKKASVSADCWPENAVPVMPASS